LKGARIHYRNRAKAWPGAQFDLWNYAPAQMRLPPPM